MVETIITGDLAVNTYLYNFKENKAVIIDPGDEADKIINIVESKGLEIAGIILTHGHFDHVGAIEDLKDKFNTSIYIHSADSSFIGPESKERHLDMFEPMGSEGVFYVNHYFRPTPSADIELESEQVLQDFGLEVIHTPGHSPGSICLYSENDKIVFTGDTLFKNGLGRTDFGGGDYSTLLTSLEKLFKLPGDTTAYPGHGPATKIKDEQGSMQLY